MYIIHEPAGEIVLHSLEELDQYSSDKIVIEAAGGLVLNQKGELLLMYRRGIWDMPKGKLDEGETIEACALREVAEETGLHQLALIRKLKTTYHTYTYKGKNALKPSHWFLMEYQGSEVPIPQTEEDITEIRWVNKNEAKELMKEAYASIKEMVEEYFLI